MRNEKLVAVYTERLDQAIQAFVVTDRGNYEIDGDGYKVVAQVVRLQDVLPSQFRGNIITEVRCDGEDIAIRLQDGSFVTMGWTIDTNTGDGQQGVFFHFSDEIDDEFMTYYNEMSICQIPQQ